MGTNPSSRPFSHALRESRYHANVLSHKPRSYFDWPNSNLSYGETPIGMRIERGQTVLGKGKYAVVYDCYSLKMDQSSTPLNGSSSSDSLPASTSISSAILSTVSAYLAHLSLATFYSPPDPDGHDSPLPESVPNTPHPPTTPNTPKLSILSSLANLYSNSQQSSPSHVGSPQKDIKISSSIPTPISSVPLPPRPPSPPTTAIAAAAPHSNPISKQQPKPASAFVMKVFRPDKTAKLKREVLILKNLHGGPNIVEYVDCILLPDTQQPAIVMVRAGNVDWREFYASLAYDDIRFWMRELVLAVAWVHAAGIIHRDLKPHNICIDPVSRKLTLIDFGLADFYFPQKELNLRVASRFYKPPEILLGNRFYDYSFDMWAVGCILAGMVFRKEVFFHGEDDTDQLRKITAVLGTRALHANIATYGLTPALPLDLLHSTQYDAVAWYEFVDWSNGDVARDLALEVLDGLIVMDHQKRWSADECLEHEFFKAIDADDGGEGEGVKNDVGLIVEGK
ncbi:Casein kinase II subunit alpha [Chytriomyces hyalinus]|nr:Casein kinase II subunit alpha [Chytriomyces hyalinus]